MNAALTTDFATFEAQARALAPRVALVLGSGLGGIAERLHGAAAVGFGQIPGFVAPTVKGHSGRVVVGHWEGVPVLVFQGRVHYYEGHSWSQVVAPVRLAANLGVSTLMLTNAAGGIHPTLQPGDLMVIRNHIELLQPHDWQRWVADDGKADDGKADDGKADDGPRCPACERSQFTERPQTPDLWERPEPCGHHRRPTSQLFDPIGSAYLGRSLFAGTYAGLTGPSYETPAEIRALRAMGADAVGMSTVKEAAAAQQWGLRVVAISCITNQAAGLSPAPLDHTEVEQVAGQPAVRERVANLVTDWLVTQVGA